MLTKSLLLCIFLAYTSLVQTKKTRIVFFGDSITEAGARDQGYIVRMQKTLADKGNNRYELMGAGIGGNKVYDLYLRLEEDVLAKTPDAVVIWIGVNDVWHKTSGGTGTDFDKFQKFYLALIKKLQEKKCRVVLVTPAAIGEMTDCSNTQDGDLNKYSKAIRKMAADNKCALIDLRKIFLEYNLKNNPENKAQGILTTDGVHLNEAGNQLVAEEMMKGLGF